MSKDIHTPREELICGAIDRAEDIARAHSLVYLMDELSRIRTHAERMEAKLVSRKQEAEHHSLYVQALKSELAALKAGQGEAVAYVKPDSPIKGHTEFCRHETWMIDEGENIMIAGGWFPLYLSAQPASADAVSVPRELLESLLERYDSHALVRSTMSRVEELRALLAQSQEVKS